MKTKIISAILFAIVATGGVVIGQIRISNRETVRLRPGYLRTGVYVGEDGKPLNKTLCSTIWVQVPDSKPARYTCSGTVSGSGPLGGDSK
jgi:hypothetical protein